MRSWLICGFFIIASAAAANEAADKMRTGMDEWQRCVRFNTLKPGFNNKIPAETLVGEALEKCADKERAFIQVMRELIADGAKGDLQGIRGGVVVAPQKPN